MSLASQAFCGSGQEGRTDSAEDTHGKEPYLLFMNGIGHRYSKSSAERITRIDKLFTSLITSHTTDTPTLFMIAFTGIWER